MKKSSLLFFIFLTLQAGYIQAADSTSDPNEALRKALNPPGMSALRELERTQKLNNELAVANNTNAIRQNTKDATAYARRGKGYSGLKQYDLALKDYDRSLQLDPKLTEAYIGRAVARYMQEDYDGSWEDVHKAESLGGEFWPAFMEGLKQSSGRDK